MSLVDYRRRRHFGKTAEPEPGKALPLGERPIFVVQLHHAAHRHYDFRLQVGDVLKSWAVPKGPSYDPAVMRMAVEVEDHPLDYADFEGEIPKGEYGGGHVAQFDHGVWATPRDVDAQLAKGHLRFELFGDKLKGEWHLVRSGKNARQPQWLLFKENDDYAGKLEADDLLADVTPPPAADAKRAGTGKAVKKRRLAPPAPRARKIDWATRAQALPGARKARLRNEAFAPQLARLSDRPPEGAQWLHEVKWDGYRLVTTVVDGQVRIWSRNAIEWSHKLPEIRAAIEQLGLHDAAFDGELIAGTGAQADFNLLQATLSGERPGMLSYALFDLLHLEGIDIAEAPLIERKALLAQLLAKPVKHLAFSSHIPGDGKAAYALASEQRFEGIVCKRADRPYRSGRGDDWRKVKRLDSDEFAVVGYTPGKGSRTGFGSLLLARPDREHGWVYAGRVGSGFSEQMIHAISQRIGKAGSKTPTVKVGDTKGADLRSALWFKPMFVVEVVVRGVSATGVLRQPSLKGLRPDKDVADLRDSDRGEIAPPSPERPPIRISNPDKLIFPSSHITKQQVADYYRAVSDYLLPEIAGRPLSVIRCPNGTEKPCFFQKHHSAGLERVGLVRLKEEGGHNANYLVVNDADGLMELVQFNALEFHPWGSHADDPDRADRIVFDLDPGPGVPFAEVKRAAVQVRGLLEKIELASFLRTTGGKGLHVVVPLNPGCDWDPVKRFTRAFADSLAQSEPQRFLSVSTLKLRPKKIFIDYLRNGRGATAVASYSLRARPGAPVALPIAWSQLGKLERGDAYTLREVPALLKARRRDPWAGIGEVRQNLAQWAH